MRLFPNLSRWSNQVPSSVDAITSYLWTASTQTAIPNSIICGESRYASRMHYGPTCSAEDEKSQRKYDINHREYGIVSTGFSFCCCMKHSFSIPEDCDDRQK